MAQQSVTLAPGELKAVSFEVTSTEAKTYNVSVDGLSGSFIAAYAPARVFGVVTDAGTHSPIVGATVYLAPTGKSPVASPITDSFGRYSATFNVTAGYYGVFARHPSYYDSAWQLFKTGSGWEIEQNIELTPK